MTQNQLLYQIANVGYLTSYGRDKCYSTIDITTNTSSRFTLIGVLILIFGLIYPFLSQMQFITSISAILVILGLYFKKYTDQDKYIFSAKALESVERDLQMLYFEVKSQTKEADLSEFVKKLRLLDKKQKNISVDKQVFGSDLYAHQKLFWNKKINSKWFVDELDLELIDKLPLSFFLSVFIFLSVTFMITFSYFLTYHLVANGYAISIVDLLKGFCK